MAQHANGHPFEKRFLDLDYLQLVLSYRQALRVEKEQNEKEKTIHKAWGERMENYFRALYMFTDHEMYKKFKEHEEMEEHEKEVDADEFPELWDDILSSIPTEVVAVDEGADADPLGGIPVADDDEFSHITGFVPYTERKKGGAKNGDE